MGSRLRTAVGHSYTAQLAESFQPGVHEARAGQLTEKAPFFFPQLTTKDKGTTRFQRSFSWRKIVAVCFIVEFK